MDALVHSTTKLTMSMGIWLRPRLFTYIFGKHSRAQFLRSKLFIVQSAKHLTYHIERVVADYPARIPNTIPTIKSALITLLTSILTSYNDLPRVDLFILSWDMWSNHEINEQRINGNYESEPCMENERGWFLYFAICFVFYTRHECLSSLILPKILI